MEWLVKIFVNFVKLDMPKGAVDSGEIDVIYMQTEYRCGSFGNADAQRLVRRIEMHQRFKIQVQPVGFLAQK